MATFNFPDIKPDNESWNLSSSSQVFRSGLNGVEQIREIDGAKWKVNMTFTNRDGLAARALRALLLKCRGRVNRFYLQPNDINNLGDAGNTGLTDGAVSEGGASTLNTKGWDINVANLFQPGDWFSVNNELKMITDVVSSDGSGNAVLVFEPPIRKTIPDESAIEVSNPKALVRLSSDDTGWDVTAPIIYAISFQAEEVIE